MGLSRNASIYFGVNYSSFHLSYTFVHVRNDRNIGPFTIGSIS